MLRSRGAASRARATTSAAAIEAVLASPIPYPIQPQQGHHVRGLHATPANLASPIQLGVRG
jgi:hypothetical protein